MNRIIQKTTSVILSLATVALIGAPAFAAYEPQETLNDTPAVAAEAAAEPTEGRNEIEIEESGKEETAQAQNAEPASTAAEETEEEPTEEKSETETAVPEETPDETETERGGSELPEISKEEIEEILRSDEVINALEEAGVDGEEIEDIIENEEYEVIYVTKEEFEKMRLNAALDDFKMYGTMFLESFALILLIPFAPILFCVPFAGWMLVIGALASPLLIIGSFGCMVFLPALTYAGYKLEEPYVLIEE